jgi:polyhydroxybutyrate depolymerase
MGGNPGSGGGGASGGAVTSGGRSTTGGTTAAGGTTATGGTTAKAGTTAGDGTGTGGATSTAGRTGGSGGTATGGRTGTGGGTATGGSTGGTTGAGGTTSTPGGRSPGCDAAAPTIPNRKTQQTISIDGSPRYYLLNVPSGFDNKTALPLVFALHGYDMNNISLVDLYDFTSQSGNKAITVLPQGEGPEPGTTSHWGDQVLKSTWSNSSYTFIQTLKTDIEKRFCIDTGREFITGFSMGGMFTNSMACDHTDWFRAFAPVEGMGTCTKANAKPAIMIHQGTGDTTVKPESGEASRDSWSKQNGCNSTGTSIYTGCTSYGNCTQPVIYCVGNWTHTVDRIARANIWSFFNSLQ